jgi:hypothetical protein
MPHLAIVAEGPGPRRPADPALIREIVADLRRRHSYATAMITALRERLEQDSEALASAAALIICVLTTDTGQLARRSYTTPEQRKNRQEETRTEAKKQAKLVVAKVLLNLMMPNNKQMRHCTGAEMKGFGVAYAEIAKRVGENTVGAVLTEAEVRALLLAPTGLAALSGQGAAAVI